MSNRSNTISIINNWLNRLAPVLLFGAMVWLCWEIARIIWLLLAPIQAPTLANIPRQSQIVQVNNASTFNIFSDKSQQPIAKKQAVAPSNIEVHGVMVANPKANSSALISVSGKIKNYRLDSMLEGGSYKLVDVDWNEIILVDNGKNEFVITMNKPMNLDQAFKSSAQGSTLGMHAITPSVSPSVNPSINSATPSSPVINYGGHTINNTNPSQHNDTSSDNAPLDANGANNISPPPSDGIDNAINELKKNPASYLGQMGVLATSEGYEVTDAMPIKLRKKIGLNMGDKVISVNGHKVGINPSADAQLLAEVKKSHKATVQIQRGAKVITINPQF